MSLAGKGIDVRQSGVPIVFRASLKDSTGAKVTSGTTTLALYEAQSDGTLKSYDFSSNTFKTTALTTATLALTHQTGNNGTVNTGIWTGVLSTLTGLTRGGVYLCQIHNAFASPPDQERQFQYGDGEGDFTVYSTGRGAASIRDFNGNTFSASPDETRRRQVEADALFDALVVDGLVATNTQFYTDGDVTGEVEVGQFIVFSAGDGVTPLTANELIGRTVQSTNFDQAKVATLIVVTKAFPNVPTNLDRFLVLPGDESTQTQADVRAAVADIKSSTDLIGTPAVSLAADVAAVKTDTGNLVSRITATLFNGMTSLANWLRAGYRSSTPDATALAEINSGAGTYDATAQSLQAIKAAVGSGGGGSGGGDTIEFKDGGIITITD